MSGGSVAYFRIWICLCSPCLERFILQQVKENCPRSRRPFRCLATHHFQLLGCFLLVFGFTGSNDFKNNTSHLRYRCRN
jgi:hypothetical protein